MDMGALPPLWLAYLSDPSDSGRIHSNVRQRWLSGPSSPKFWAEPKEAAGLRPRRRPPLAPPMPDHTCVSTGDPLVVEAMRTFAELADGARLV